MKRRKIFKKKDCTTSSSPSDTPSSRCNNEAENIDSIGASGGRKSVGRKIDLENAVVSFYINRLKI